MAFVGLNMVSRPRLEVVSSCTEERASNVSGKLRFKAQRVDVERHSSLSALGFSHSGWNIAVVGGRKSPTWSGGRAGGDT